jgi:hypothetical protein
MIVPYIMENQKCLKTPTRDLYKGFKNVFWGLNGFFMGFNTV